MIIGVGTDIIEIARIKSAVEKSKHSFLHRIFTDNEIAFFESNHYLVHSIAGGFAAKEAVMKALGTGLRGFQFKDIEILRDHLGKPYVKLYNGARKIADDIQVRKIHLSISHCKAYATAYVVAEE